MGCGTGGGPRGRGRSISICAYHGHWHWAHSTFNKFVFFSMLSFWVLLFFYGFYFLFVFSLVFVLAFSLWYSFSSAFLWDSREDSISMPVAKRKRASSSLESTRVWNQLKQCLLHFISPTPFHHSLFLSTSLWHSLFVSVSPLLVLGQVQGALATGCQLHDAVAEAYTHQGCQAAAGRQCTTNKAQANGKLTHPPRPYCKRPGALENPISHQLYRIVQKCLNTLDLTSLGIGSCCGTGMYLVAGMVAQRMAGPGVVISFIIAAIASIFSGKSHLNLRVFSMQIGMGKGTGTGMWLGLKRITSPWVPKRTPTKLLNSLIFVNNEKKNYLSCLRKFQRTSLEYCILYMFKKSHENSRTNPLQHPLTPLKLKPHNNSKSNQLQDSEYLRMSTQLAFNQL